MQEAHIQPQRPIYSTREGTFLLKYDGLCLLGIDLELLFCLDFSYAAATVQGQKSSESNREILFLQVTPLEMSSIFQGSLENLRTISRVHYHIIL